jgi:aminopeptidase YwaD
VPALAAIAALLAVAFTAACSSGGADDRSTPTSIPSTATSTVEPTPTVDPVGPPEVDGARAYEHVRVFTQDIGPRVAGTEGEIAARDYIERMLASFGYDVQIQEFEFDGTRYRSARVDIDGESIDGIAFHGSGSGSAGGTVVAAGLGAPDDFPPGGLNGGVALIERGTLTFADKATNAINAGAGAIIVYNNEEGPFFGDATDIGVPMIAITRDDGERIIQRLAAGELQATVTVDAPASRAFNVIASPRGVTACETVTGGHYDSVPAVEGADDNASGTAGVIELARVVAARRLPGAHCFALFSAEEFGLYGSQSYVDALSDTELNGLRAMLNLDVIGTGADLTLIGSDDMIEVGRIEAGEVGVGASRGSVPIGAGSDHASFEQVGVPVLFFYRHDDLIHTEQDALGRIVPQSLEETVTIAFGVLEALNGE